MVSETRLTLRIDFGARRSVGPGKIRLLEAVGATGSISKAGRSLGMSYRRAWLLVDETNRCLVGPAVATASGGEKGGGSALTALGADLVLRYRTLEHETAIAVRRRLRSVLRAS